MTYHFAVNEKLIAPVEYNKHLGIPWDDKQYITYTCENKKKSLKNEQ
jgi:hypothetical protein